MSRNVDIYKNNKLLYTDIMTKQPVTISSVIVDRVTPFLVDLGLNQDQITAYIHLLHSGTSSVLNLAKAMGSGRTRLYPILESLVDLQLVKVDQQHYGTTYEALNPRSLEFLVTKKETETNKLRQELDDITETLSGLSGLSKSRSKVVEYRGIDGLKQINFNQTKGNNEVFVYEVSHLDEHETMPKSFVDRMRRLNYEMETWTFDLSNNKDWDFVRTPLNPTGNYQKGCYISEDIFKIKVETYIYNDVVAYLGYDKNEPFGVEIYNEELADQQKQLFKLLWKMGNEINKPD